MADDRIQDKVKKSRDEPNQENIVQDLNPENLPQSLAEDVNTETSNDPVDQIPGDIIKLNEEYMKSTDPKVVAQGCVFFANRHAEGIEVPLNFDIAAQLYSKAADAGNAEGMYNLGLLYQHGQGVTKDLNRAVELFEQAAELPMIGFLNVRNVGVAEAQYTIGNCYRDGVVKNQDYLEAFNWYTRSCENGSGEGANNLAFLYRDGLGVEMDEDKAVELWTVAANRGVTFAMESLAWNYLKVGDVDQAEPWFQRSIDGGNVTTLMNKSQFDSVVEDIKSKIKGMQSRLGLDESYNTFTKCRQAAEQRLPEEMRKGIANLESVLKSQTTMPSTSASMEDSLAARIWKCVPEIELKAAEKYKYALIIKHSVMAYGSATTQLMELMKNPKKANLEMKHKIVNEYGKCFGTAEFIASMAPQMRETLSNICQELFTDEKSQIDLNARICHVYLTANSLHEVLEFLRVSKLKYPTEIYFHSKYCHTLGRLERFEDGITATTESLKIFPNNVEILYSRAVLFRFNISESDMEKKSKVEIVKRTYSTFLQYAPMDHRRVPEAYYCLAYISLISDKRYLRNKKIPKEVSKFYESGLQAEDSLLQCFLPYDSNQKKKIETFLDVTAGLSNSSKSALLPAPISDLVTKLSELQLTNPNRVNLVLRHRDKYMKCQDDMQQKNVTKTTQIPIHAQAAPIKLTDFIEISLAEMMASNRDHVYNGFVLNVTIMEDSIGGVFESIHTIISDANGDFQRCFIYNLDHEDRNKQVGFGSTLSIVNPHFRLTMDGDPGIRVDDPNSIIFHTNGIDDPKCRYCGVLNPDKNCAKCKRARYCSKECQQGDWKKLKHKLICIPTASTSSSCE